jgi:hypothetical protein
MANRQPVRLPEPQPAPKTWPKTWTDFEVAELLEAVTDCIEYYDEPSNLDPVRTFWRVKMDFVAAFIDDVGDDDEWKSEITAKLKAAYPVLSKALDKSDGRRLPWHRPAKPPAPALKRGTIQEAEAAYQAAIKQAQERHAAAVLQAFDDYLAATADDDEPEASHEQGT